MIDNNAHLSRFVGQMSFLRDKITERSAYLGVTAGSATFLFSLFLSWSQARSTSNLEDAGYSSGWSESGYLALLPLSWVIFCVIRGRKISPNKVLIISAVALVILVVSNVLDRSVWITKEYQEMTSDSGTNWKNYTGSHNSGSDLGFGFWLGLIAILVIEACGMSWSLHKLPPVE